MKGVDIVVGGNIGHMSAFMAQAGRLVVRGDAGEALGDSIYEARIYVRGEVASLGADCIAKPMRAEHHAELAELLAASGFRDDDTATYTRYGSARNLYHFHVDNASATDDRPARIRHLRSIHDRRHPACRRDRHLRHPRLGAKRRLPHFDDLLFLGASMSRYPLEGYRERCGTDVVPRRPACQTSSAPGYPGHHRRHELRRAVRAGQGGPGPRGQRGRHLDHHRATAA